MAVVIEFYVPKHFRRKVTLGPHEPGKVIAFDLPGYSPADECNADGELSIQQLDGSDITARILGYAQTALSNSAFTF